MTTAYLGLGSNVHAERNLKSAATALRGAFPNLQFSPVYRSRAVGFDGEDFLNLAARVETTMHVEGLRRWLRALEARHGRDRGLPKYSDRTLDIDILLYGSRVSEAPGLPLPRPEILRFAHVLRPLADLAPTLELPGTGRTLLELWESSRLRDVPLEPVSAEFLDAD